MEKKDQSLTQYAYDYLKSMIMECKFLPGSSIDEKKTLDEISISRTPFREALLKLETENLVEIRPRSGIVVKSITEKDIREVFCARKMIEPMAVIEGLNRIDLNEIVDLNNRWHDLTKNSPDDYPAICKADLDLHMKLVSYCNNTRIINLFRPIIQEANRISIFNAIVNANGEPFERTEDHHNLLIDAIICESESDIRKVYNIHMNFFMASSINAIRKYSLEK